MLVFEAHRLLYHSTLGVRVIKKKRRDLEASPALEAAVVTRIPAERCMHNQSQKKTQSQPKCINSTIFQAAVVACVPAERCTHNRNQKKKPKAIIPQYCHVFLGGGSRRIRLRTEMTGISIIATIAHLSPRTLWRISYPPSTNCSQKGPPTLTDRPNDGFFIVDSPLYMVEFDPLRLKMSQFWCNNQLLG